MRRLLGCCSARREGIHRPAPPTHAPESRTGTQLQTGTHLIPRRGPASRPTPSRREPGFDSTGRRVWDDQSPLFCSSTVTRICSRAHLSGLCHPTAHLVDFYALGPYRLARASTRALIRASGGQSTAEGGTREQARMSRRSRPRLACRVTSSSFRKTRWRPSAARTCHRNPEAWR
jgi:hypothetical protein